MLVNVTLHMSSLDHAKMAIKQLECIDLTVRNDDFCSLLHKMQAQWINTTHTEFLLWNPVRWHLVNKILEIGFFQAELQIHWVFGHCLLLVIYAILLEAHSSLWQWVKYQILFKIYSSEMNWAPFQPYSRMKILKYCETTLVWYISNLLKSFHPAVWEGQYIAALLRESNWAVGF